MGVGADRARCAVAERAANAGDDADRRLAIDKLGPLLDMRLDEGGDVLRPQEGVAAAKSRDIPSPGGDMGRKAQAVVGAHDMIQLIGLEQAKSGAAADIGRVEPDAFLGADRHDRQVAGRCDARPDHARRDGEASQHSRRTVEIAAAGHGIEMRSNDDARAGRRPGRVR